MRKDAVREHVDYEEAKRRILAWWERQNNTYHETIPMSWFADVVWPGHRMRAQGAALAVSPIIIKMRREGLVSTRSKPHGIGYYITK